MSKTLTKKELRAPDRFQMIAGQGASWFADNLRIVLVTAGVLVLGAAIWVAYGTISKLQETKTEEALFPLQDAALKTIIAATDSGSLNISMYIEGLKAHTGRKASAASAIQVIGALNTKENTEALQKEVLAAPAFDPSESSVLYGLWNLTEGLVYLRNGEFAAAKDSLKEVLSSQDQTAFHPTALLQLGAIAEKEGDINGAKDFYSRITREHPDSEAKKIAEKLLIHIDLLGAPAAAQGS